MAGHEASQTPSRQPQTPPAPLTPAWLRAHFDPLPFPARRSALARYARSLTPDAYATLRHALAAGDPDERHTALFLAVVRRDLDRVAEALTDPLLGRRARAAALRLPVPEQALERLTLSDIRATRYDAYRLLRLSRRRALAARLLPAVHERHGAREAAALLPACPEETVAAWLPRVETGPGTLHSLARTAPCATAAYLAEQHERYAPQEAHRFVRRHLAAASVAARRDPRAALLLLDRAPRLLTPQGMLRALHRPAEALAVLRTAPADPEGARRRHFIPGGPVPPALRRALAELPVRDLVVLAEHCTSTVSGQRATGRLETAPDGLLRLLPPAERRRVLDGRPAARRWLSTTALSALAALEPSDRTELVTPWLERYRRSLWNRPRVAAALPLADGEPLLRELAGNHRLHHRATAWPALLACAELDGDPQEFARVIATCERAWHDQDDVRRPALEQLAGAPPRLLDAVPERALRDAVLTAVQSRDSTAATLRAVERLLYRVVERAAAAGRTERAAHAAGLFGDLVAAPRHTTPVLSALRVDETAARALWTALSPTERQPAAVTALAELLGPHLAALPGLDAETRRVAVDCDDPRLAARAAAAWVRPPHLREERCAELIAVDATFATVPVVLRTLAARRTDLLDPLLAAARGGFTGRLRPRSVPWTPKLCPEVTGRWLASQRNAWAEHHARVAAYDAAPLHARADAARLLRDPQRLTMLVEQAPQPVAAAALTALGEVAGTGVGVVAGAGVGEGAETGVGEWAATGGGEGAATGGGDGPEEAAGPAVDAPESSRHAQHLLRHAATGGVRGRAAMAALGRLLERMPDGDAVRLLAPVASAVDAPVGSRKEAARALRALPGEGAFRALLAAWDAPRQHPDVRAVLAWALLPEVGRPDVAGRLVRAAHEPAVRDAVVHARVRAVPDAEREAYTAFLTRLVVQGDEETVAAACRALPSWLTSDCAEAVRVLVDAAVDPERPRSVWCVAARQLVRLPSGPATESVLRGAFDALAERARAHDPGVRVDALRRLHGCTDVVRPSESTWQTLPVLDMLADTLEAVGLHADAARLSWEAAVDSVRQGKHEWHPWDRLVRLCEAGTGRCPQNPHMSADFSRPRVRAAALTLARTLRARGTGVSGSLALFLVRAAGHATDWAPKWRAELDALRAHADPDTAMAALLVGPEPPGA
ncbi:hypothetical protein [Streptomyces bullii]|uniref:HEAT repeat-containing protein n=1 Tax=Streptomyces bullii TaxID=349910 RepID=A0ABW0UIP2_9ACTN